MNSIRIIGIVLILAGIAGLAYGGFSFTKETHNVGIGSLELSVEERESVNVPNWFSFGAIGLGLVLLVVRRRG